MYLFATNDQRKPQLLPFPKAKEPLDIFQKHVEGNIEIIPHKRGDEAPFIAFANEEGMIQDLPSNYLSWGVLRHLGFICPLSMPFHFGNVILMGKDETALTKIQQKQVEAALKKYLKEMGEDDEDEDKEEEVVKKPAAKKARKE